jgi:hypothetical protein
MTSYASQPEHRCRYSDNGAGFLSVIILLCLWSVCTKLDKIQLRLDKLAPPTATQKTKGNYHVKF